MKIEKRAGLFWTGRMSWLRYMTLWSFKKFNPDWKVSLYYYPKPINSKTWSANPDADVTYQGIDYMERIDGLDVEVVKYFPSSPKMPPAHICDIFQWNWLANHSGFYFDVDILWLQSMDGIYSTLKNSDAALCLEKGTTAIGFIGSAKCSIFRRICNFTKEEGAGYQHYGTQAVARAFQSRNVSKGIQRKYPYLDITILPDQTVYPLLWNQVDKIFEQDNKIGEDSIGLHWFGGDPISQVWNNRLTESNWQKYNNTITTCLKGVLNL